MWLNLRANHNQYLVAEDGGGNEGKVIAGRQAGLARANREGAGAWETVDVNVVGGYDVTIMSSDGYYACAERAGLDEIVVFNRRNPGSWETWKLHEQNGLVGFESTARPGWFIKAWPDGSVTLGQPMSDGVPTDTPGPYELFTPSQLLTHGGSNPVGGQQVILPVMAHRHGWADAQGPRGLVLASFFPALYFERHDPARVDYVLDLLQQEGIHGVRAFGFVGATGWGRHLGDGWRNREVLTVNMNRNGERLPAWPDARDVVVRFAQKLAARGMVWNLTAGDLQLAEDEALVYALIHGWLAGAGLLHVIGLVEVNEGWQNSRRGNDPNHFARLVQPFANNGIPWGTSAHPEGIDRWMLEEMALPGSVSCIHGPGGTTRMVRNQFNNRHDGEGIGFRHALAFTEPRGPGPDVSAGAVNEAGWVALGAACAAMTGSLYVVHTSQGIRDLPTDHGWETYRPYFRRAAAMVSRIPHAFVTGIGHGGRGGHDPESIFASTRPDELFHEDQPGITGEFHRGDSVQYANGEVAGIIYGGVGHRRAKLDSVEGVFYDTHGNPVRDGRFAGVVDFGDPGDGLLFVGRRV